jgi:hypothetical protein
MRHTRIDWFIVLFALLLALGGCGGGCAGCGIEPIPGGFPAAKRNANAGQLRVTPTALQKIAADPAGIIGPLAGSSTTPGIITFPIPAACSGTPTICCPGGTPSNNCGPVEINLNKMANDADRLALTAANGIAAPNGRLDVTLRARVKTQSDLIISISGTNCKVHIDTTAGSTPDLVLNTQVGLNQDGTANTTRIAAGSTSVTLESADYSISPVNTVSDFLCFGATFIPKSVIEGQLASMVEGQVNDATCKACPSGNVAECGSSFATACTGGVCQQGNQCLQEIGLDGRMRGSSLFASLSPGTTGAIDLYEVAGGYSLSNNNGLSLGLLGGMEPAGTPRDLCGPMSAAPAVVSIPQSAIFQNNTFNSMAFDVGIGLHKSQLAQFAYAGYNGGLLCLTLGSSTVAQLSTDTISLLSRSLGKLVDENSPMSIGIRPQSPPTITLGKNTFTDDGMGNMSLDEPLLDIRFSALEIDFFASIDDQYNRVFTVVTDVHLPIGLQTSSMGTLTPVIGNPMDAFTNVTVKNNEAITESPAEIAGLFPTLLAVVLPQLSGGLGAISLPTLGGLALDVKAVTAVDNDNFLAIFANLVPAPAARVVDTSVDIVNVTEPSDDIQRNVAAWATHKPPSVTLAMSGSENDLEYSYRINGGTWSAWSASKQQTLAPRVFWLPGTHKVEVRARRIGDPASIDLTPARLDLPMGLAVPPGQGLLSRPAQNDFHGQAGAAGCSCDSSRSSQQGALFALVIAAILLPMRRLRRLYRKLARLGTTVWLAALASLPGCSCGSAPCGDSECLPGDVEMGAIGRFTSVAGDDKRVLVATYDQLLGDLVVVDATSPDKLVYKAVDGVPTDITPTHDPDTYRGGIEDPGPNVGAYTSIALIGGTGRVAYQDRDEHTLKYAYETKAGGSWKSYVLDEGDAETGVFSSIAMDGDQKPAIAYMAVGIDDGAGHRTTELRLARANSANPASAGDWSSALIASAPGSCGGICGSGEVCVVGAAATDPQSCVAPTTDCTATCADTEACVMGACRERIDAPKILQPPLGTGLYVSLVTLSDGRLAAAYYDGTRRALILAVESGKNTSMFAETVLDGDAVGADRGMWASAVVGADGATVHVAYQDALGDQLMYTSWSNGTPGTPVVVDDGQRPDDRTHPVGAAAAIYMAGGEPAIAYQDGLKSDVYVATHSGSMWTTNGVAVGPLLDGFSIGATSGHGTPVLAWGSMDPALSPPTTLIVRTP